MDFSTAAELGAVVVYLALLLWIGFRSASQIIGPIVRFGTK